MEIHITHVYASSHKEVLRFVMLKTTSIKLTDLMCRCMFVKNTLNAV